MSATRSTVAKGHGRPSGELDTPWPATLATRHAVHRGGTLVRKHAE